MGRAGGGVCRSAGRRGIGLPIEPRGGSSPRSPGAVVVRGGRGLVLHRAHEQRHGTLRLRGDEERIPLAARRVGSSSWQSLTVFTVYAVIPLGLLALNARGLDLLALGRSSPSISVPTSCARCERCTYVPRSHRGECSSVRHHGLRRVGRSPRRPRVALADSPLPAAARLSRPAAAFWSSATSSRGRRRPLELPVCVITALVGVPIFAVLLRRTLT